MSINGEGLVSEIPVIDGVPVMLLWPLASSSEGWTESAFIPYIASMPASVDLEDELSAEEADAWLKRLGVESNSDDSGTREESREAAVG